eukprot:2734996-Prymnesium_polylepis.1
MVLRAPRAAGCGFGARRRAACAQARGGVCARRGACVQARWSVRAAMWSARTVRGRCVRTRARSGVRARRGAALAAAALADERADGALVDAEGELAQHRVLGAHLVPERDALEAQVPLAHRHVDRRADKR